jgi:phosphatidylglycerophosphate synthase
VPASAEERRTPRARGFRRLFGIDRSGPRPAQTQKGEPLRPWTLPNLIGYLRLAAIPVFLLAAFDSGDGRSVAAGALYLFITAGDYLDGFIARATGQYSRLGALLDPAIDRLAALAGAAVCWHFELLPRWALVVLVVRELATVALARLALRRGLGPAKQARGASAPRGQGEFVDDTFPDVGSMSDEELKELIEELTDEEREISYKRRLLHGKIDILRAELVNRMRGKREAGDALITGDDVQALTDILLGRVEAPDPEEEGAS